MSAPRVKVALSAIDRSRVFWMCRCTLPVRLRAGYAVTLSAAADAGRAHLASFHTAQMPPEPPYCSVHETHPAYCVESHDALTDPEPVSTYCRTHGTHGDACGCGSGKSPAGVESGAYRAAQPFGDDFPCCTTPMQHAHTHSREDT